MSLNTLDLFIIGAIGISGLFGLYRGFVTSILSLFTWLFALWLPFNFTTQFSQMLPATVESATARAIVAATILFFGAFISLSVISWLLRKLLGITGLTIIDRLLGVGLGVIRGVVIVAVIAMFASSTSLPKERFWGQSELLPHVLKVSEAIREFMPASLSKLFVLNAF